MIAYQQQVAKSGLTIPDFLKAKNTRGACPPELDARWRAACDLAATKGTGAGLGDIDKAAREKLIADIESGGKAHKRLAAKKARVSKRPAGHRWDAMTAKWVLDPAIVARRTVEAAFAPPPVAKKRGPRKAPVPGERKTESRAADGMATLLGALRRPKGATYKEMAEATGYKEKTCRARVSGLKSDTVITAEVVPGRGRVYHAAQP